MESSATIFLSIASLFYMMMVAIIYFTKEKISTSENKIFRNLIIVTLISLFAEIYITIIPINIYNFLFKFSLKNYLVLCVLWISYFMEYVFIITRNNENKLLIDYKKKYKKTYIAYWIFTIFIVCVVVLLPIYFYNQNGMKYSYGPSVDVVFGLSGLYTIIMFLYIVKNIRNVKDKGYMPIILFVILLSVVAVIQKINPGLLLANTCFSLITILMYFTIENPDIRKAKDLIFAKKIAEESKNKTLNILNEIDSELNDSLNELQKFGYKNIDYKDMTSVSKELKFIKKYSINFVDKVKSLIEVGKIESESFNLKETNYESYELLEELKQLLLYYKKNRKINVLTEFETKIPSTLYGDKIIVLKLILALYDYLLDIMKDGNLLVRIESFMVRNFSRIKIHFITQCPRLDEYILRRRVYNIEVKNVNDFILLDKDRNIKYEKILKLVSLLDAKLDVAVDEYNKKDVSLSIKQRVIDPYVLLEQKEENIGLKVRYFNASGKKMLMVNNNNVEIKEMLLLLNPYKIDIDIVNNIDGMEKKLLSNKTYDVVIIDDDIYDNEKTYNMIKELKKNAEYDLKMLICVQTDNKDINNKYINDGFDDYLFKPINKKNINYLMKKYLK